MKKLVVVVCIFVFFLSAYFFITVQNPDLISNLLYYSPCDKPVLFRIGFIDKRYNITSTEFLQDIEIATHIWEQPIGKNLFHYDSKGELQVNMVFDKRQSLTNKINQLEGKLKTDKSQINSEIENYKKRAAEFNQKVNALNEKISYWNSQGGAPEEEFNKLKEEQDTLKKEAEELNALARSLNQSTDEFNSQVGTLNNTIGSFNQAISLRPEQGVYKSGEEQITIYFTQSDNELIHTLAHEFGHAIRLEHIDDENAVMYPYTTQVTVASPSELSRLRTYCEKRFIGTVAIEKLQETIDTITTQQKEND